MIVVAQGGGIVEVPKVRRLPVRKQPVAIAWLEWLMRRKHFIVDKISMRIDSGKISGRRVGVQRKGNM